MAKKTKPSELEELVQLTQLFQQLQAPQLQQESLDLDRQRLAVMEQQNTQQAGMQDRQFQESVRQFNQQQDFRQNDSLLDMMSRLGTNPNIDADVLMGSLGEIDPRVGAVVEKSNKAKSKQKIATAKQEYSGVKDRTELMKHIGTFTPEEQALIIASLPQLGLPGNEAAEFLLPPSTNKKKEKPKASFSPGGRAFGAY